MEISELTIKLIIILVPGAIASLIYERLTIHKKWTSFEFIVMSILFGGLSYILAQYAHNLLGFLETGALDEFWNNLPSKEIPFYAVSSALVSSIFIGLISSSIDHYKVANRIGKKILISNKYGDENLYSYFLNANNIKEVYFRDKAKGLTYHGEVESFSEADDFKELVLRDVKVYSYENSELFYEIDKLYIARSKDDITMEVPHININEEK